MGEESKETEGTGQQRKRRKQSKILKKVKNQQKLKHSNTSLT